MARRSNGEGSIYQAKDGRWRGQVDLGWKDGKRDRKYLSGRTKAEVAKKIRDTLTKVDDGLPLSRDGRGSTVEQWLWYWHETVQTRRVRESTLRSEALHIRKYLVPAIGKVRLRDLTPEQVEAAEAALEARGLSAATALKMHRTLSRALKVAMQRGLIARNVCTLIDAPASSRKEVKPLTEAEARRILLAAAQGRNAARWSVALALGLRQGEALGLAWPNVDLDKGTVAVKQALGKPWWRHGCTDKLQMASEAPKDNPAPCGKRYGANCPSRTGHSVRLELPKSRAGQRVVALPNELVDELRAQRTAQVAERLAAGSAWWVEPEAEDGMSWDLVFRTEDGRPLQSRTDWGEWKKLLVTAKVRAARLHDARHTAASMLLAMKVPARVVMEVLGHSQIALTMNTYSHVMPELEREAADAMGGALWGSPVEDTAVERLKRGGRKKKSS